MTLKYLLRMNFISIMLIYYWDWMGPISSTICIVSSVIMSIVLLEGEKQRESQNS